ncbi:hypothetical protein P5V15_008047 [Pogonomyrmex californicus]
MLKIVGLWPQESKNQHEELLSKLRLLFSIIMLFFILIPALVALIRVWGNMILMIDNLQYTLPLLVVTLKIFIMCYKKKALSLLIKMIVKDWTKVKIKEERNVMIKQARITRLLAMCGLSLVFLTFLIAVGSIPFGFSLREVTNLTDPGKPLALQSYYFYDTSNSPKYELTYLGQVISLIISGLFYTGVDNFLGLLILHICGQMENLHLRLLNLKNDANFKTVLKTLLKNLNIQKHIHTYTRVHTFILAKIIFRFFYNCPEDVTFIVYV